MYNIALFDRFTSHFNLRAIKKKDIKNGTLAQCIGLYTAAFSTCFNTYLS